MPDLKPGVCVGCEREMPVAPCCNVHMLPICGECYMALNSGDGVCRVAGAVMSRHPSRQEGADERTDAPTFEASILSGVPVGPLPEQEVTTLSIQRVEMRREDTPDVEEPVAVVRMQLATKFTCEGYGEEGTDFYHARHEQHVLTYAEMLVGQRMVQAMIDGMMAVRDNTFEERQGQMMDEELRGMTETDGRMGDG